MIIIDFSQKSYEETKKEISKMSSEELKDVVRKSELDLAQGLKTCGFSGTGELMNAMINICGQCSGVACKGSEVAEKKPALKQVFTNDILPLEDIIENYQDLFFGRMDRDFLQSVMKTANAIEGGISILGTMMLAIAYCDGNPTAEALESIKEFYGE